MQASCSFCFVTAPSVALQHSWPYTTTLHAPQVVKGFCDKADGKDKLTALIQVCWCPSLLISRLCEAVGRGRA